MRTGNLTLNLTISNLISSAAYTQEFQVQDSLHRPTIIANDMSVFTLLQDPYLVQITNGTHYFVTAEFGDGHVQNDTKGNVRGLKLSNFTGHIYARPGPYQLRVNVSNSFGSFSVTKMIFVVSELPNFTVVTNSPVEIQLGKPPLASRFGLLIAEKDRVPLSCSVEVMFGDGSPPVNMTKSVADDIWFDYFYTSPLYYLVYIRVFTMFDSENLSAAMSVQERLAHITINIAIPDSFTGVCNDVVSSSTGVFLIGTVPQLTAVHIGGTGATYVWSITDLYTQKRYKQVTNETSIIHNMAETGNYEIKVIADNGIGAKQQAISYIKVIPNGIIAEFQYNATAEMHLISDFTVKLLRNVVEFDKLCVKFRLGKTFHWFSSAAEVCLLLNDADFNIQNHVIKIIPGSDTYTLRHKFLKIGMTPVCLTVSYIGSNGIRSDHICSGGVNVTVHCHAPENNSSPTPFRSNWTSRLRYIH